MSSADKLQKARCWMAWCALCSACPQVSEPPIVDTGDEPMVSLRPSEPYAGVDDLVCRVPVGARVSWWRDGAPWDGEAQTTDVAGDTISGGELVPGEAWRCEARGLDEQVIGFGEVVVQHPSIVLIVVDDLGYGDVGTFGHPTLQTPALDRLSNEGAKFTAAYVSAPMCSPSRAAIMTGRQQNRFGFEYNIGVETDAASRALRGLPITEQTLGDLVSSVGLPTALIGKWHLGTGEDHHPNDRGFDDFFGFLDGRRLSLAPGLDGVVEVDVQPYESRTWPVSATGGQLERNRVIEGPDERHLTDHLADEAVDYISSAEGPFFLYLSLHAPHVPIQAGPDHLALVPEPPEDEATWAYQATVAAMDRAIGSVLEALDASGASDHTLVVFTSDNGCIVVGGFCSNGPLQGGKLTFMEGGLRVPFLVRWPGRVDAGIEVTDPVSTLDIFPTIARAVGAEPDSDALDGVDLVSSLRQGTLAPRTLFWRALPVRAVLDGGDKVVHAFDAETRLEHFWMFDVPEDPGESADLSEQQPERISELLDAMDQRAAEAYVPPSWTPRSGRAVYYGVPMSVSF